MNATKTTIHLQGIGEVEAVECGQLKPGMRVKFNYGYTSEVIAVEPAGKASVKLTTRDERSGKTYEQTKRTNRLIGLA
jgi:hypothetical protein